MPDNKNILLISYYFPPLGMGGVKRPYALFKYLPEFGYDVTVVTVKNICYPEYDYSRMESISEDLIHRTGSTDPSRIMYLLGIKRHKNSGAKSKLQSRFFFPDSKRGWNKFALRKAKRIIKKKKISTILTTSPPLSTHLIGMELKEKYDIPWIADFRDFWFSLPIEKAYMYENQVSAANRIKNQIVNMADEIVSVNNCIKNYLGRGQVIMNGAEIGNIDVNSKNNDTFVIGVLGTINYLCPIEPLFRAVASLIKNATSIKDKINIVHVGNIDQESKDLVNKYNLRDVVELHGYLPVKQALETIYKSDVLYLAVNQFDNYHILPSRIFDYLVSGLSILGVVSPDSDAALLLKEHPKGKVVGPEAIDEISEHILNLYEQRNDLKKHRSVSEELRNKYSTRAMAEKYSKLLDRLIP